MPEIFTSRLLHTAQLFGAQQNMHASHACMGREHTIAAKVRVHLVGISQAHFAVLDQAAHSARGL